MKQENKELEAAINSIRSSGMELSTVSAKKNMRKFVPSINPAVTDERESNEDYLRRSVVNELHDLIGIPEINQFKKFRPLSTDANKDTRYEQESRNLRNAKAEAQALKKELTRLQQLVATSSTSKMAVSGNSNGSESKFATHQRERRVQALPGVKNVDEVKDELDTSVQRQRLEDIKASLCRIQVPIQEIPFDDGRSNLGSRQSLAGRPRSVSSEMDALDMRHSCSSMPSNSIFQAEKGRERNPKQDGFFRKMAFWKTYQEEDTQVGDHGDNGVWI